MSEPQLKSRFADRQPKPSPITPSSGAMPAQYMGGRVITRQDLNREYNRAMGKKILKGLGWLLISPLYIPYYVTAKGTDMLLCAEEREGGWTTIIRMTIAVMAFLWLITWMNPWLAMGAMTLIMFARLYLNKAKTTDTMF